MMMPVRGNGRRYFAFYINCDNEISKQTVIDTIYKGVRTIFGDFGVSLLQPTLIEYEEEKREGIIRCNRSHSREMRAVLALITEVSESEAAVRVTSVSGTIKSLKSKTKFS